MSWFNILKIDNFYYDPEDTKSGYYNPRTNEVNFNFAGLPKGASEEDIINEISAVANHEYAHKAMNPEMEKLFSEIRRKLTISLLGAMLHNEDKSTLDESLTALTEAIAMEEAFAYYSEIKSDYRYGSKNLVPAILLSSASYMTQTFQQVTGNILAHTKDKQQYDAIRQKLFPLMDYSKKYIFQLLGKIELKVAEFMESDEEINDQRITEHARKQLQRVRGLADGN